MPAQESATRGIQIGSPVINYRGESPRFKPPLYSRQIFRIMPFYRIPTIRAFQDLLARLNKGLPSDFVNNPQERGTQV